MTKQIQQLLAQLTRTPGMPETALKIVIQHSKPGNHRKEFISCAHTLPGPGVDVAEEELEYTVAMTPQNGAY